MARKPIPSPANVPAGARWRTWAPAVLLVLAVLVTYWPAYSAGYIWDDEDHLVRPGIPQTAAGLWLVWFKLSATPQYYPVTWTTFWLEAQLWGLKPLGYHVVNVLLHAGGAVLLWRIGLRLRLRAALAIAAVWALHPINVESVAWVSERKNVLSGLFYLAATLAYLRFADSDRRWGWYAASLALFIAAVLSKTVTGSLPAVLILLLWWQGRMSRRHAWLLAPMFGVAVAVAFVTAGMEQWAVGAFGPPWELSFADRCLIAGRAVWFYAWKLVWPATLMFNYPRWSIDAGAWWQWLFPVSAVALVTGLWALRHRVGRGPLVAVLVFGGTLFPALGFVNLYPHRFSFVADHFQYLAGIALLALLVEALAGYLPRWGFVPVAIVLAALSFRYARAYHDVETIWSDTLAKNPDSWIAVANLGAYYAATGQDDRAAAYFRQSLAMHSDQIESHLSLAAVLERRGDSAAAAEHYRAAQPIRQRDPRATYHLARLARDRGDAAEAVRLYAAALAIDERYEPARLDLAELQLAAGRPDEAVGHYERALQLNPYSIDARRKLAAILFRGGYVTQAIDLLGQAESHGDHSAVTANNLGVMLMQARRLPEAEHHFRRAVAADPGFAEAHYNLGRSLESRGDRAGAIASYKQALQLKPDLRSAADDLRRLTNGR